MVLDAVSNFVRGRVSAPVATSDTTVSVEDASIFPDPSTDGEFNVVIWDANNFPRPDQDSDVEIVRVTARDTDANELTVERGQETTSDVAHPEGSAVHLSPTAKMFSDIEAEYTAQGENFDGEGTSEFSNLQSLSTESLDITEPIVRLYHEDGFHTDLDIDDNIGVVVQNGIDDYDVGAVELPAGNFVEDAQLEPDGTDDHAAILLVPDDVELKGQGRATVIKLADDQDTEFFNQVIANSDFSGNEGGMIRDLVVDGNRDNQDVGTDAHSVKGQWEGIDLVETVDYTVENVLARNALGDGIDLDDCPNNVVRNTRCEDNGSFGIHITTNCEDTLAIGNVTTGNGFDTEQDRGGIDIRDDNCMIVGHVSFSDNIGIVTRGRGSESNEVVGCTIYSPSRYGVHNQESSETTRTEFRDVTVIDAGDDAFNIEGTASLSNPIVRGGAGRGIHVHRDADVDKISDPVIESVVDEGVRIAGEGTKTNVSDPVISDSDNEGILVEDDAKATISDPDVDNLGGDGIRVQDDAFAKVSGGEIRDANRGFHGVSSAASGLVVRELDVYGATSDGIRVGTADGIVQVCLVDGAGDAGFELGSNAIVTANVARNVTGTEFDLTDPEQDELNVG